MRVEFVRSDGTVGYLFLFIDSQNLLFRHSLQQITKAVDGDLVGEDEYALAAVVAREGVNHTAEAQDDVAPAFAPWRPVIELAERRARFSQIRIFLLYAEASQTIKNAKLLFAQALVRDETYLLPVYTRRFECALRRLLRTNVWRREHDRGLLFTRQLSE